MLRTFVGRMEIERDGLYMRIVAGKLDRFFYGGVIPGIDYHVYAQARVMRRGNVFYQPVEGPFAAHLVVKVAKSVEAHPDRISFGAGKRQLGVGGYRDGIEPDGLRQADQAIQVALAVAPQGGFAALEIDKARAKAVGIFQLVADLIESLDMRIFRLIYRAVPACKIALVGNKQDGLQRPFVAEAPGFEKP